MDELLSLKWNNHQATFINAFGILRDKQLYTDTTLACEGKLYSVHKIVLSTCSDYFGAILDHTNCKSPVIILKDIRSEDLEYLLDYMYLGEVNVPQNSLATLLKAAECLQLKGLAVPDDDHRPHQRSSLNEQSLKSNVKSIRARNGTVSCSERSSDSEAGSSPKRARHEGYHQERHDVMSTSGHHENRTPSPRLHHNASLPPSQSPVCNFIPETHFGATESSDKHNTFPPSNFSRSPEQEDMKEKSSSSGVACDLTEDRVKVEYDEDDHMDETRESGNESGGAGGYDMSSEDLFKQEASALYDKHHELSDLARNRVSPPGLDKTLPSLLQHTSEALQSAGYRTLSDISSFARGENASWPPDRPSLSLPLSFSSLEGSSQHATGVRLRQLLSISSSLPPLNTTPNSSSSPSSVSSLTNVSSKNSTSSSGGTVSCTVCHKLFSGPNRRQVLRRHLIIHTGERPYPCHLCQYRANQKSNLNVHILTYHGREHLKTQCS